MSELVEPFEEAQKSRFAPGSARSVLSHKIFRRVFIGAFLSNIGMWMQNVVLGALAYDLTESSTFVGIVVFAQLGPMLFLAMLGGLMADRLDRRRVLVVVSLTQLVLSLGLAGVVAADDPNKTALVALTFLIGVGQAIYGPTFTALLPELVHRRDLAGAVSLNSAQMNASRVIGPVIGAFIDSLSSASSVFIVNGAARFFVIVALLSVQLPKPAVDGAAARGMRALVEGIGIARRSPVIGRCLLTIATFSFISLPFIGQMPVLAERNLGIDERSTAYGALYAAFGTGAVLGALAIGSLLREIPKARVIRWAMAIFAASLGVLAVLRTPAVAYPVVLVVGLAYMAIATSLMTVLQTSAATEVRGRVMALWIMGWAGMVPLGNLVAGPIIEWTSITAVVLAGAAFALVLNRFWSAHWDERSTQQREQLIPTADQGCEGRLLSECS